MTLFEPERTQFDLSWRMFGVRVRIHPMFWLVACLMGGPYLERIGVGAMLLWVALMLVSILVHELGHVIAFRVFGNRSHVILYAFGGLAIPDGAPWKRWQRIVVSLAGPAAGFLLFGATVLATEHALPLVEGPEVRPWVALGLGMLWWMNLVWNILNLLPIWPLDGGQVSRELLTAAAPRNGLRLALGISFLLAATLALHAILYTRQIVLIPFLPFGSIFTAILFGMLAVESFMMLQQLRERSRWNEDRDPWDRS